MKKRKLEIKRFLSAVGQEGFSLVEIMAALAVSTIVLMAGYVVLESSNHSYNVQEDVSEAQQNVRMAMERLVKDVRMAGFGLPDPPFSLTIGGQTLTAPVVAANSSAGPDTITLLGIGFEAGKLSNPGNADPTCNGSGDSFICLGLPASGSIDNFFDGTVFNTNRIYINIGGGRFIQLANGGHNKANRKLQLFAPATLDRDYADNTPIYIIQAVQYTRNTALPGCSAANPCLASNDLTGLRGTGNQVLAENIEDIQFAYGIDANPIDKRIDDKNGNGVYEDTDYRFSVAGDAAITDPASIIAVRANIVARTRDQDPNRVANYKPQCLEDRGADAGCTGAALDAFRRRTLTKIIKLRNPKTGG